MITHKIVWNKCNPPCLHR